jgi:hypothetical protein
MNLEESVLALAKRQVLYSAGLQKPWKRRLLQVGEGMAHPMKYHSGFSRDDFGPNPPLCTLLCKDPYRTRMIPAGLFQFQI